MLQTSVLMASETAASIDKLGYFLVGTKISKGRPKKTTVTIEKEFAIRDIDADVAYSATVTYLSLCSFLSNPSTWSSSSKLTSPHSTLCVLETRKPFVSLTPCIIWHW